MTASDAQRVEVDVSEVAIGETRVFEVRTGLAILVCNVDGEYFAIRNRCPHQDFALTDARLRGSVIECPLHGGRFDVREGCPTRAPTTAPLQRFALREIDADGSGPGRVEIEIPRDA